MGGFDVLPGDLWSHILFRLPVKSILRCRLVCKSCHSLISSPIFISNYESRNLNKSGNRLLVQLHHSTGNTYSFSSRDESFKELSEHMNGSRYLAFVGSCNGLICFYQCGHERVGSFQIWNPTIWKIVELPCPKLDAHISRYGFGLDTKTSDYKVMVTTSDDHTEIFYLRKNVWRGINGHPPRGSDRRAIISCPSLYLNGALHWIQQTTLDSQSPSHIFILSFNMSDEVFLKIQTPLLASTNDHDYAIATRLVTSDGLMCIIHWNEQHSRDYISIWVMKEYGVTESWTNILNIDLWLGVPNFPCSPYKIHLWGSGQLVLIEDQKHYAYGWDLEFTQDLLLYTIETGKSKCLHTIVNKTIINMIPYKESLELMLM